jgi:chemotaxis protein CheD
MQKEPYRRGERVTIDPGEFYVTDRTAVISTILGSCVAACLYDPGRTMIGMNHFLLSSPRYSRDAPLHQSEAGRYGIHAMELLINAMMNLGAHRPRLRAKVAGGASLMGASPDASDLYRIGEANCQFIRQFMTDERIPVDAEDLGGEFGRVIHFSNGDFSIHRRKIGGPRRLKIIERDQHCWQAAIDRQAHDTPDVELWTPDER